MTLVLILLCALGFLLVIAGLRLIGLVAAVSGGILGWCLGGVIHGTLIPEWSPAICATVASVACAALAALFIRPAVAVGFGAAGTIIGALIGGILVERGIAPTAPNADADVSPTSQLDSTPAQAVRAARSGFSESMQTILGQTQGGSTPTETLARLAGAGSRIGAVAKSRWDLVPAPTRTFLLASTAAGAIIGFGVGVVFARWALAGASSALGTLLLLACGIPLMEKHAPTIPLPKSTAAWILVGAALTLAGWAFQMRRVQRESEPPRVQ